ncbi:DUF167 family protein YggU [Aliagarivorans taiwanensis]|uniref:DUF167 family protein YggU n=1 Tax=Aliagarivorans taiwanensis TaxID=561966 RepID=UPI00041BE686|nr:DUF167 family protein YggU [Aliagarivorans taiwanensis]
MPAVSFDDVNLLLQVYVQPKASRDSIVGLHGEELKIAITAPPVDGKANQHLTKYLAKQCKVAKSQVSILRGELGRHKTIQVQAPQQLPDVIAKLLTAK